MDTAPLDEKLGSSLEIQETPVNLSSTTAASTSSVLRAAAKEFVPSFVYKTELKATVLTPESSTLFDDCENKQCARCSKMFYVTSAGQYLVEEACTYHWGKLRGERRKDRRHENDRFTCCSAKATEAHRVSRQNSNLLSDLIILPNFTFRVAASAVCTCGAISPSLGCMGL